MDSASRDNPSFSSSLLDEIYRSIDEQSTQSIRSKFGGSKSRNGCFQDDHDDGRRACLMQKWMENKVREKPVSGRRSAADLERSSRRYERELFCLNSRSCDLCCCETLVKPKPIRTERDEIIKQRIICEESQTNSKHQAGKFVKTKSKALKIYSDLKQPISPGGRLATFLNSLFTTGNNKKPNTDARSQLHRKSKSANASTCSSASSFSRSCLSNTPSSRGKLSNGIKRSVRFYDQDCQPCGHKSLHQENTDLNTVKFAINKLNLGDKNRHISRKSYQNKECNSSRNTEYENPPIDDGGSDSSSDLFELDHLSAIGIDKYREELPVYETTQLNTNRHLM